MSQNIKTALISVFHKESLAPLIHQLKKKNVSLISTGGTGLFIEELGYTYTKVETLTGYPEIFGGRVKTLHPAIFGGILNRRASENDKKEAEAHQIISIDLVIVDLYPFEETLEKSQNHEEIIEKIDIGGISLIRAAAKNYQDVLVISHRGQYEVLTKILNAGNETLLSDRKKFAAAAFEVSAKYDSAINRYLSEQSTIALRYGENPHQKGYFRGNLDAIFNQISGKELSYNNLLDVDAAMLLMQDFDAKEGATFAILKHNNACGIATHKHLATAYQKAFEADTLSAFGGILICNHTIDFATAEAMNSLFYEIIIAPDYAPLALEKILTKKNRIVLKSKNFIYPNMQERTLLNGHLIQERDAFVDTEQNLVSVSKKSVDSHEMEDALFALKIVKHTKSNAIVLVKNQQLLASGTGQTSRVDALQQAIAKANHFKLNLKGSIMASDAFFPFPDCVEIANIADISVVVHPGGSKNDQLSISYCDEHNMAMLINGHRHFKH